MRFIGMWKWRSDWLRKISLLLLFRFFKFKNDYNQDKTQYYIYEYNFYVFTMKETKTKNKIKEKVKVWAKEIKIEKYFTRIRYVNRGKKNSTFTSKFNVS